MVEQSWLKTPTALTVWTLGTGLLGGLATYILTKRVEKEGWTKLPVDAVVGGVIAASLLNIIIAASIKGE